MDAGVEARLASLEEALERLAERLERIEQEVGAQRPAERRGEPAPERPPAPPSRPVEPTPPRPALPRASIPARTYDLEELLGGRVLAWLGGLAVLIGVVFFLVMAVRRGWIDEPTRVVLAFLGSTALLALGLYLYERQGRTEAAIAAVSASIAALYASLTAATALYDLVSPSLGLAIALVIGASATAIAVRWSAPLVAALGIVGGLLSPVLVDAGSSNVALAFMAIALLSATGVLLWRRWNWLGTGAFVVSAPQLVVWIADHYEDELAPTLVVLALFWAVYVAAAVGYELRVPTAGLRTGSALLMLANALLVAAAGWLVLHDTDHDDLATAWVVALALVHVAFGTAALRSRISAEIAILLVAVGLALSAVGLALALDGPALVAGWAAEAAVLAWVGRRTREWRAYAGTAAFLALAGVHVLLDEAPPDALRSGVDDLGRAIVGVAVFAAAALFAAWQLRGGPAELRGVVAIAGAVALVYLPSIVIVEVTGTGEPAEPGQTPQVFLSAFWTITGLATIIYGLLRDDRRFRLGGFALLGIAVAKVYLYDSAELEEIYRVLSFIALGLLLLAGAFAYQRLRTAASEEKRER